MMIRTIAATSFAMAAVGATVQAGTYVDQVLATNPDNLVAYWQLNEFSGAPGTTKAANSAPTGPAQDGLWGSSGYGGSAPLGGVLAGPRPSDGFAGLAADNTAPLFTSSPQWIQLGGAPGSRNAADEALANNNMTVSFFLNAQMPANTMAPGGSSVNASIFSTGVEGGDYLRLTYEENGKLVLATQRYKPSGAQNAMRTSASYNETDGWIHIVAVRNGDDAAQAQLYINGVLMELIDRGGTWTPAEASFLGVRTTAGGGNFVGAIDEVAVWNTALNAQQVAALYAVATTGVVPEPASLTLMGGAGLLLLRRRRSAHRATL